MIQKLKPSAGSQLSQILLCDTLHIDELPNPRIVPLFGPNGIGKSSVIKGLLEFSKEGEKPFIAKRTRNPMMIYSYCNSTDNTRVREPRSYLESFDPNYIRNKWNASAVSEGQSILYSALGLFDLIGTGKHSLSMDSPDVPESERKEYLVLIDEIDSGLSIDNLDRIMRKLKNTARKRKDIQVIFSFNHPLVLRYFPDVISLYTGHPIQLYTMEDMMNEIKRHEKEFRRIRYRSDGSPKVFT